MRTAMPRFYFHVRDDADSPDEEGVELPDAEAARDYAAKSARELMCDTLKQEARITPHHRIDIEDEQGGVIATVRFGDAFELQA